MATDEDVDSIFMFFISSLFLLITMLFCFAWPRDVTRPWMLIGGCMAVLSGHQAVSESEAFLRGHGWIDESGRHVAGKCQCGDYDDPCTTFATNLAAPILAALAMDVFTSTQDPFAKFRCR